MSKSDSAGKRTSLSWLARGRWNVLDLIEMGRRSVPTYLAFDVDMTWAESLRTELMEVGHKVTITAIVLKAISVAQRNHPASRSLLLPWGPVVTLNEIVAGFTVEREVADGPAVFLGAIRNADTKSVEDIASELREYAVKEIKDVPQLAVEDRFSRFPWLVRKFILWLGQCIPSVRLRYQGATFGLSTLGKFGITLVVPPSVCTSIFGVGSVEDRVVAHHGQAVIRPMMSVIYNFDHRLIDGAPAARFVAEVRDLLEGDLAKYLADEIGDIVGGIKAPEEIAHGRLTAVSEEQVLTF